MSYWFKRWRSKQMRMKHALRNTYIYRVLGERMFDHRLWRFDLNSLAGGVSLGLFVAFTPTIPFQMLLATFGAILLHVNLPVSLAACWVTNPLTALPIYLTARRLGQYLLENSLLLEFVLHFFGFEGRTKSFMEQGLYLWTGCLVFSAASAFLGNIAIRFASRLSYWLRTK